MAAILVHQQGENNFEITMFRDNQALEEAILQLPTDEIFFMKDVERTAMRQIERFFKRRLDEHFFLQLKNDPEEEQKIRKLYEVRTMR